MRDNIKLKPGVRVGSNTLKKRQSITHPVTLVGSQHLQFGDCQLLIDVKGAGSVLFDFRFE